MQVDVAYELTDEGLQRVESIKDLRVFFHSSLSFSDHVAFFVNKTRRKIGFMKRSTKDFMQPYSITSLFKFLVAPILTYAYPIWSPIKQQDWYTVEKALHFVLRYTYCHEYEEPHYLHRISIVHSAVLHIHFFILM